jgi:uncharacterized ion transporter superfamily protein YfcC
MRRRRVRIRLQKAKDLNSSLNNNMESSQKIRIRKRNNIFIRGVGLLITLYSTILMIMSITEFGWLIKTPSILLLYIAIFCGMFIVLGEEKYLNREEKAK